MLTSTRPSRRTISYNQHDSHGSQAEQTRMVATAQQVHDSMAVAINFKYDFLIVSRFSARCHAVFAPRPLRGPCWGCAVPLPTTEVIGAAMSEPEMLNGRFWCESFVVAKPTQNCTLAARSRRVLSTLAALFARSRSSHSAVTLHACVASPNHMCTFEDVHGPM